MSSTDTSLPVRGEAGASNRLPPISAELRSVKRTRFAVWGIVTVCAAVMANTLVYFIGSTIVAYDPEFIVLADVYGVMLFTLVASIGAVCVYAALRRWSRTPARTFTILSAILLVGSFVPDFTYIPTVPGATNAEAAILVTMHIVAAGVIVRLLTL